MGRVGGSQCLQRQGEGRSSHAMLSRRTGGDTCSSADSASNSVCCRVVGISCSVLDIVFLGCGVQPFVCATRMVHVLHGNCHSPVLVESKFRQVWTLSGLRRCPSFTSIRQRFRQWFNDASHSAQLPTGHHPDTVSNFPAEADVSTKKVSGRK